MSWLDTVKQFFGRDTAGNVADLARGASGEASMPRVIPSTPDSGMSGAYQQLTTMLAIDSDLMLRFADYENMDDYPEISCLTGDSLVFTLRDGWVSIRELAERGSDFWVLAYDARLRSLVPAHATGARRTGERGHDKSMVRVVFDDGRFIDCTDDHLFLTKDGRWVQAGVLPSGERLMPGVLRMRSLNADMAEPYWQVHQPHDDSTLRSIDGKRWMFVHRLVSEALLGATVGDIVHHVNQDKLDNAPDNLSIEDISSHAHHHIAGIDNSRYLPEWTPERRAEMAVRMRGNTFRRGTTCSTETRERMSEAHRGRTKDVEWRCKIGQAQPNRIDIDAQRLEAALNEGKTIAGAARILGVSWSKVKRAAAQSDLLDAAANHRVLRVEQLTDRPDVYDIEVPDYHNFVCNGVVVHNSALDIYADDATISDAVHGKVIWGTSKDKIVRDIINDLLDRRVRIDEEIWNAIRTLVKYGNLYAEVVVNEKGVLGLNWLPPPTMRRIVDPHGHLVGYVQDPTGAFAFQLGTKEDLEKLRAPTNGPTGSAVFFYPWEVVHWRLRGKMMRALYGFSVLDSARWVWKRLVMLEDSSLVCKLTKAPARYAFYVDTGELPPREARAMVDDVRRRYKKRKIVDPATGKLDFRMNPLEQCLSLETRIPLLNGTVRTLRELIMDHEAGTQNYVYAMDPATKRVKPGKISWAGVTRRNAQVLRVTLDNCQEVIATPDHQFLMRDGTYKQAQLLEPGDRVMPLYRGIASGYEYVINQDHRGRGTDKWKSLVQVHRLVAETFMGDPSGQVVHHRDDRKRNNYPENLEIVTPEEHGLRHAGAFAGRVRRWAEDNPGKLAERNRARNSGQHIIAYNRSSKHKEDNAIRSEKIALKYPDGLLPELRRMVQENAALRLKDAVVAIRELPVHEEFVALNANRKRVQFDLHHARTILQRDGYCDWQSFCAAATENHKVASVEWLEETPDTGCITVDVWHNFALDAGIFVKNSEDFFVPTRAGKEASRIDVLAGPDYDDTGVLGYFLKKLYSSLRVPPQYLGGTEVTNRAALTQEDVQFARLEMRIQREFITGLSQVVRVHLAALNIDPDSVQWALRMAAPSSIFEMQQIEVWNARAALAGALRDFFTMPWIIANIFHMSDDDALFAAEAKRNEVESDALAQAQTQADILQRFPELGAAPPGELGALEGAGAPAAEDVRRDIRKMMAEAGQDSVEVLRRLGRIEPAVARLERRLGGVRS